MLYLPITISNNITVKSRNFSNFVVPGCDVLNFRFEKRCIIKYDYKLYETEIDNHFDVLLSVIELIEYTNKVLDYIAGCIVKSKCIQIVCPCCIDIFLKYEQTGYSYAKKLRILHLFLNRGKLKIV